MVTAPKSCDQETGQSRGLPLPELGVKHRALHREKPSVSRSTKIGATNGTRIMRERQESRELSLRIGRNQTTLTPSIHDLTPRSQAPLKLPEVSCALLVTTPPETPTIAVILPLERDFLFAAFCMATTNQQG